MKKLIIILLLLLPIFTQAQQDSSNVFYKVYTDKGTINFTNDLIIFLDTTYLRVNNNPRRILNEIRVPIYSYIQFESDDKGNVFLKIIRGDEIITYRLILNKNLKFIKE